MECQYNNNYTKNRFFAALDIMGFKKIVENKNAEDIWMIFHSIVEQIKEYLDKEKTGISVHAKIFSDSIFLVSDDDSEGGFSSILIASAHFQNLLFEQGYATNGAISFGEVTFDDKNDILFGKPVNDAHLLQERLFFYGIVLHETAVIQQKTILKEKIPSYCKEFPDLIIESRIPIKNEGKSIYENYSIINCCEKLVAFGPFEDQKEAYKQLLYQYYQNNRAISERVLQYIQNTESVYKEWFDFTKEHSACDGWGKPISINDDIN